MRARFEGSIDCTVRGFIVSRVNMYSRSVDWLEASAAHAFKPSIHGNSDKRLAASALSAFSPPPSVHSSTITWLGVGKQNGTL